MAQIALKMPRKEQIEGHQTYILNIISSVKMNTFSGDKHIDRKSCFNPRGAGAFSQFPLAGAGGAGAYIAPGLTSELIGGAKSDKCDR